MSFWFMVKMTGGFPGGWVEPSLGLVAVARAVAGGRCCSCAKACADSESVKIKIADMRGNVMGGLHVIGVG